MLAAVARASRRAASTMRAVVLPQPGPVDNLVTQRVPVPVATAGQVRVQVAACGVCHRDCLDRAGAFPFIHRPTILGHEIAGTVVDVGAGVTDLAVGDKGTGVRVGGGVAGRWYDVVASSDWAHTVKATSSRPPRCVACTQQSQVEVYASERRLPRAGARAGDEPLARVDTQVVPARLVCVCRRPLVPPYAHVLPSITLFTKDTQVYGRLARLHLAARMAMGVDTFKCLNDPWQLTPGVAIPRCTTPCAPRCTPPPRAASLRFCLYQWYPCTGRRAARVPRV